MLLLLPHERGWPIIFALLLHHIVQFLCSSNATIRNETAYCCCITNNFARNKTADLPLTFAHASLISSIAVPTFYFVPLHAHVPCMLQHPAHSTSTFLADRWIGSELTRNGTTRMCAASQLASFYFRNSLGFR
jgi:hypothetical protein